MLQANTRYTVLFVFQMATGVLGALGRLAQSHAETRALHVDRGNVTIHPRVTEETIVLERRRLLLNAT